MTGEALQLYLGSSSPRRRMLLDQLGLRYRVLEVQVAERRRGGETPEQYVQRLAVAKARAGWEAGERTAAVPVLGADTAVVLEGRVLGKPRDRADGLRLLSRLSDRNHQVLTGVAVVLEGHESMRLSASTVTLRAINRTERDAYWSTGEPRDKAGGYAIQGMGAVFVANLQGSYSGVMGLPLFETAALLRERGIDLWGGPET